MEKPGTQQRLKVWGEFVEGHGVVPQTGNEGLIPVDSLDGLTSSGMCRGLQA